MSNEYHIPCEAGSLGDMLAATAVFKNGRTGSVTLTDEPRIRNFSAIFNEIAEVKFVPAVTSPMPLAGEGPAAKRVLNALGIKDYGTPYVKPKDDDINEAIEWIRSRDIKSPIVVNGAVGGGNSDHPLRFYRKPPRETMEWIVQQLLKSGFTPITFGITGNQETYDGAIAVPDLPIAKLAAMYQVIGRYIGPDTGDYHLMIGVGGRCVTLIPDNAWNYDYKMHLYTRDCFPSSFNPADNRAVRVWYVNFKNYEKIFK